MVRDSFLEKLILNCDLKEGRDLDMKYLFFLSRGISKRIGLCVGKEFGMFEV